MYGNDVCLHREWLGTCLVNGQSYVAVTIFHESYSKVAFWTWAIFFLFGQPLKIHAVLDGLPVFLPHESLYSIRDWGIYLRMTISSKKWVLFVVRCGRPQIRWWKLGGNWGGVIIVIIAKRLNEYVRPRHNQFERCGEVRRMHATKFVGFPGFVSKHEPRTNACDCPRNFDRGFLCNFGMSSLFIMYLM
jgi:hypothetical protein